TNSFSIPPVSSWRATCTTRMRRLGNRAITVVVLCLSCRGEKGHSQSLRRCHSHGAVALGFDGEPDRSLRRGHQARDRFAIELYLIRLARPQIGEKMAQCAVARDF